MKDILIFGVQWSWKSTQAQELLNKYNDKFNYFESGNILRSLKHNDNALGNYVKKRINKWKMINDGFMLSLFEAYLIALWKDQSMLIDGFPRTMAQAYLFYDKVKRLKRNILVISLELPKKESIRRLSWRRLCKKCNKIYNKAFEPDLKTCHECGEELTVRKDDKPEIVKERISAYYEQTSPVLDFFDDVGVLKKINADRWIQPIRNDIINSLDS